MSHKIGQCNTCNTINLFVTSFCCKDGDDITIVKLSRQQMNTFNRQAKLFKSHDLKMDINIRILCCYVFSAFFYCVEPWILMAAAAKKLEGSTA